MINDLYNRANKTGEATVKKYVDTKGNKLDEPIDKYRITFDCYTDPTSKGRKYITFYTYDELSLSVTVYNDEYTIDEIHGENKQDCKNIENVLKLITKEDNSPLKLIYDSKNGGFGLLDNGNKPVFYNDFRDKIDFDDLATTLLFENTAN